jgi:hypothetical protein
MFELLEVHAKSVVELGHGAGKDDRPPPMVLLDDGKTVLVGELLDSLDIGRGRPELPVILFVSEVALGLVAGSDFPHPFLQLIMLAVAQY